jgi:hypothetical protein
LYNTLLISEINEAHIVGLVVAPTVMCEMCKICIALLQLLGKDNSEEETTVDVLKSSHIILKLCHNSLINISNNGNSLTTVVPLF